MQDLRRAYTEVWVPSAVVPLVQFADRVRSIASTGLDSLGIPCRQPSASLVETLRSFDSIVSWYGSNREEFVAQCGALGLNVEFRAAIPSASSTMHAVDFFLGCSSDRYPRIEVPSSGTRDYLAGHPFSGSQHKNWPLERFRQLTEKLPVRFCVSPEQTLEGAVEYSSLYDLAAWIRGARLYIGNDSGITHLAAATGVPTVALFGYSDPRIWAPRGPHVHIVERPSMLDITVDDVLRVARSLL
jgi:heptosyltransferase III